MPFGTIDGEPVEGDPRHPDFWDDLGFGQLFGGSTSTHSIDLGIGDLFGGGPHEGGAFEMSNGFWNRLW